MARCRGDQAAVPEAVAKEQGEQTKVVVREGDRERSYFMKKPGLLVAAAAAIVLLGGVAAMQWFGANERAAAQAPRTAQPRAVSVEVGAATKKKMPVIIEGLGSVTPLANVAVRTRIDSEIVGIHFTDGALVKAGDLLVSLDTRALEAQIRQAEAQLARDQAQLEGAERDFRRYTELVARQSTPQVNLDNARTQVDVYKAAIRASQALIDNLKIQLSYCSIRAPISGRISQASVKVGNQVRTADAPVDCDHQSSGARLRVVYRPAAGACPRSVARWRTAKPRSRRSFPATSGERAGR